MKIITPARYNAEYFERGKERGISCYENYRWLPALTIPMAQALVTQLGIKKTDKILDFGCAKGYVVKALRMLGYDARGCDVSEYALDCSDAQTREHLCLVKPDSPIPPLGDDGRAWDWIIAKDVLEHLTHEQIDFTLAEFYASAINVFSAIPLGDGREFVIPEMEHDVTHVTRETLAWWTGRFYQHGFARVQTAYEMRGIKQNWTDAHPYGNGFIISS